MNYQNSGGFVIRCITKNKQKDRLAKKMLDVIKLTIARNEEQIRILKSYV